MEERGRWGNRRRINSRGGNGFGEKHRFDISSVSKMTEGESEILRGTLKWLKMTIRGILQGRENVELLLELAAKVFGTMVMMGGVRRTHSLEDYPRIEFPVS